MFPRSLLLTGLVGCGLFAAPLGPPPAAGTYTSVLPGGPSFTVDPHGAWSNGDVNGCMAGLTGTTLTLDCYGGRQKATWHVQADGSVRSDVLGKVYGEFDAAEYDYRHTP